MPQSCIKGFSAVLQLFSLGIWFDEIILPLPYTIRDIASHGKRKRLLEQIMFSFSPPVFRQDLYPSFHIRKD
jgi:hypothetical protein